MKKIVSLLVALATAFGVSATAFAAQDDIGGIGGVGRNLLASVPSKVAYGTSGNEITLALNELVLVEGNNNAIVMPETHLAPGKEYVFKIFRSNAAFTSVTPGTAGASLTAVTEADLGGGKLRTKALKGTSTISSVKIDKKGSGNNATFNLVINTKENWGTKLTDVEYEVSTTGQTATNATNFATGRMTFKVGYAHFTDEEIDEYSEGGTLSISNDKPVILKKQFDTLAKNFNYKNVEFEADDGSWAYLGKVSGMGDTNFTYTHDVAPSILQKFEAQDFKFITFGAGVNFVSNGEMRIDVSDVSGEYHKMYAYLYRNGKLTPINATYDTGADELVFRTNFLGSFVITNEQITDTTIIQQPGQPAEPVEPENPVTHNPQTGAPQAPQVAVTLGLVSLATVAALSRKKK